MTGANAVPSLPTPCMNTISVSQHDRLVALAAPHRFWLAAHIEALPDGHPRKRLVAYMALYARDVLTGELPGPSNDDDAERFARLTLADRPLAGDAEWTRLLDIPLDELCD
jgi:hypothetical protein